MATSEHKASLRRLIRLRRINWLVLLGAGALSVVSYFVATEKPGAVWPGGLFVAIGLAIVCLGITERIALRTRCPKCGELFFQRPVRIGAGWRSQDTCVACRFNLYRGDNVEREG